MEDISHTVLNESITASISLYNPNMDDDEIPESVFDRTLTSVNIGELFQKNNNDEYANIETTQDRTNTKKNTEFQFIRDIINGK